MTPQPTPPRPSFTAKREAKEKPTERMHRHFDEVGVPNQDAERWTLDCWERLDLLLSFWFDNHPEPEPETERVPWWEALADSRTVQGGSILGQRTTFTAQTVTRCSGGEISIEDGPDGVHCVFAAPDGTVEVLKQAPAACGESRETNEEVGNG